MMSLIIKYISGFHVRSEVDAYNNRKFRGIVTQIASSVASASSSTSTVSSNDVTNYKVHIRLSREIGSGCIQQQKIPRHRDADSQQRCISQFINKYGFFK